MVNLQYNIRHAQQTDYTRIANLMYSESRIHRHLDWRAPLDWLGTSEYWLLEQERSLGAALACPPDPAGAYWLRLFALAAGMDAESAWRTLWDTATAALPLGSSIAAITAQEWFMPLLRHSGFRVENQIIVLHHTLDPISLPSLPPDFLLRPMTREDLPSVAAVDAQAFEPLWQNSLDSLRVAYAQAGFCSVILHQGQIIGYQISTRNPFGAHLARLAVLPSYQGHGIGHHLVADVVEQANQQGLYRLSVNTQIDNTASLTLYKKIGFHSTNEAYSVFTCKR